MEDTQQQQHEKSSQEQQSPYRLQLSRRFDMDLDQPAARDSSFGLPSSPSQQQQQPKQQHEDQVMLHQRSPAPNSFDEMLGTPSTGQVAANVRSKQEEVVVPLQQEGAGPAGEPWGLPPSPMSAALQDDVNGGPVAHLGSGR